MADRLVRVVVAFSPSPRKVTEIALELPSGATVRDALAASGVVAAHPQFELSRDGLGVWGRRAGPEQPLRDGDRVELYRPLRVDPKVARRERFGKQGARSAGLFSNKRPGAKAGY